MPVCHHPHHRHPEHHGHPPADPAALVKEAVQRVRSQGMRRTALLERVLDRLARSPRPLTVGEIGEQVPFAFDPASLYRLMERLERVGVVRRLGLHERALYYEFIQPGVHCDYLLCTSCGAIGKIEAECPVDALQRHLAASTGYTGLRHELVFYGVCPECGQK